MPEFDPFLLDLDKKSTRRRPRWFHLPGIYRTRWVEENFDVESVERAARFIPRGTSHVGSSLSRVRLRFLYYAVITALAVLMTRLVYLQIFQGNHYRQLAENNSERIIPISSERGLVFDRRGRQLTKNIANFSLVLIPQDLPREPGARAEVIARAAAIAGRKSEDIQTLIDEFRAYRQDSLVIKGDLDYDTALKLHIQSSGVHGIFIAEGSKRWYGLSDETPLLGSTLEGKNDQRILPLSLSHILGYMGKLDQAEINRLYDKGYLPSDTIGKTGIEKIYESVLRGEYGRRRVEVNVQGKEQSILAESAPKLGYHLSLAIDVAMQQKLESIMLNYLKQTHTSRAAGIVMDPRTGEILAIVSLPGFQNNDFAGGIDSMVYDRYINDPDHPLFNRAISGVYPSGSTIKPVIASAALEEGIINPNTSFLSVGGLQVGPWFFPDWKPGGHGTTNVTKSLAWSVNTFYYYIGGGYGSFSGLGVDKITGYLRRFGFGSFLGVDLSGEESGFVPTKQWKQETKHEPWYIGDTYNLSIGQGDLLVTPLQIAAETMVVANGGTLYRPRVAKGIINPVTSVEEPLQSDILRQSIVKDETLLIIRQGMRECVTYGSCHGLSRLPFPAAGKTGTAQWNSAKPNHAWFTSFAPFNKPEITVTILVEEGREGSAVAAPIANEFYAWWWEYRNT